ncbi:MAG: dihydrodipicolinate synthase family protein [Abditibacteriaceae bacterium]
MNPTIFEGVWSAAPTPLTEKDNVDSASIKRLVKHHLRLGVKGVFLAGSCGEGPWLADAQKSTLVQETVKAAKGELGIAVQVTDNSAARILDNIARAKIDGAEYAVVAAPFFLMHATPEVLWALYEAVLNNATLPIIFYDRGAHSSVDIPVSVLKKIYEHPAVVAIKDSSTNPERMKAALAARRKRKEMRLLTGDEFDCVGALRAGYNGLMLGGAAFNGLLAGMIRQAALDKNWLAAEKQQKRMNNLMFDIYGGKKIRCWLAGEKYILEKMGVFKNHRNLLGYELTESCAKRIDQIVESEEAILLP